MNPFQKFTQDLPAFSPNLIKTMIMKFLVVLTWRDLISKLSEGHNMTRITLNTALLARYFTQPRREPEALLHVIGTLGMRC